MAVDGLAALYAFDGKRVAGLRSLARSSVPDDALLAELPGENEVGASWVLKARAEADVLSEATGPALFPRLPQLTQPDAILHLLQMVQHVSGASPDVIRPFLKSNRTLLRVWALDALTRVAADEAAPLVAAALEDTSAAMRARARALQSVFVDR